MKKEKVFSRALSAMLILFGVSVGAFADDDAAYDTYDDTHNIKIHKVSVRQGEIPNDGQIPSDAKGTHLGEIIFGGRGTNVPAHDGSSNENGKKQIIDFSDLNYQNYNDDKARQASLQLRFGGAGTFVYGDVVSAGNPIIKSMSNPTIGRATGNGYRGGYITDGGIDGFNSSKDSIKLPKGVTKNDIVFARVYWYGHLYNNHYDGELDDRYSNGQWPKVLNIKSVAGYQDIKLKIADGKTYDIKRDTCQGRLGYNSSRGRVSEYNGGQANQRYSMIYTCSADITNLVRDSFRDYADEIEFAVGNINAQDKIYHSDQDPYGNQTWDVSGGFAPSNNKSPDAIGNEIINSQRLPYGGWYVVLVYDKTIRSQKKLMDNYSKIGMADEKKAKEYIDKFYKPKSVTLYDGYLEAQGDSIFYTIDGFYTPKNGEVQGKLILASFGANGVGTLSRTDTGGPALTGDDTSALYVAKTKGKLTYGKDSPYRTSNEYNAKDRVAFNGSKTKLVLNDGGKYITQGSNKYHQGFDLDEFDISSYAMKDEQDKPVLGNGQNTLEAAIVTRNDGSYNRALVPFFGISIDLYTPKLCYNQKFYDTAGWLKFYSKETGEKITTVGNVDTPDAVAVGETLYYRTEIRNQEGNQGEGEAIEGAVVELATGASNTYNPNSAGINNTDLDSNRLRNVKFSYLVDDKPGAYTTNKARSAEAAEGYDSNYAGKTIFTTNNNNMKFRVGSDAGGEMGDVEYAGGRIGVGQSAYMEFNATVGNTYVYTPMRYTLSYSMNRDGKNIVGPKTVLERCDSNETEQSVKIRFLNGLKVVNQNFKDLKDRDKNSEQDDRLYTQVAELPFDVNMVFQPDINDIFQCAIKVTESGKCPNWDLELSSDGQTTQNRGLCARFPKIFKIESDGTCQPIKDKKLSDGTIGIDYDEANGNLQVFELPGKVYMSAIRAVDRGRCRDITREFKLPFKVGNGKSMVDYHTEFETKQTKENKVLGIKDVEILDAFQGVTFMLSYYPNGLGSEQQTIGVDENTTLSMDTLTLYEYDADGKATAISNPTDYYVRYQIERLYEYYINKDRNLPEKVAELLGNRNQYNMNDAESDKRPLEVAWLNETKTATGYTDEREAFEKEKEAILDEINRAKSYFGVEMSQDGSFHVCDSDSFVVRPAYFEVDMEATDKYAKLVDPAAKGDITEKLDEAHTDELRTGGDYASNKDVLSKVFYAKSFKEHAVPNYTNRIGGNLSQQRFSIRNSYYSTRALEASASEANATAASYRETLTYLKPFISNDCRNSISDQSFFIESKLEEQTYLRRTSKYQCANKSVGYTGFAIDNGRYQLNNYAELNKDKNATFGKVSKTEQCLVDDKEFSTNYRRVWDKDAITLWADFRAKDIHVNGEGVANIESFTSRDIRLEALKEPEAKTRKPAALFTEILYKDKNSASRQGEIFNYYNVGDVMVSVYDNSWTDAWGDQTFDKRENPSASADDNTTGGDKADSKKNKDYWGTKCIINSTANKHDERGRIGCDIGIKQKTNKKENNALGLVLRYQPDRINMAIVGLENGHYEPVWNHGGGSYDANASALSSTHSNGVIDTNGTRFAYFNSVEIENDSNTIKDLNASGYKEDETINEAVTKQLSELAKLRINATAYLDNAVYKDVVATLYDGRMYKADANATDAALQPLCGFASDMDVVVGFNYDCAKDNSDGRCLKVDANVTKNNATYKQDKNLLSYTTIPKGTEYFAAKNEGEEDKFDEQICQASANYDSRCYSYNDKNIDDSSEIKGQKTPFSLKHAISFYTDGSLNSGLVHKAHKLDGKNILDPKFPEFILMSSAFKNGETPTATIYFNFDRMQKHAHLPALIYPTDFSLNSLTFSKGDGEITPAKFDNSYKVMYYKIDDIKKAKAAMSSGVSTSLTNFKDYAGVGGVNMPAGTGTYAYFIYGKSYDQDDGSKEYQCVVGQVCDIKILEALYCGKDIEHCATMLSPSADFNYLNPKNNIFNSLKKEGHVEGKFQGFITNKISALDSDKAADVFVSRYDTAINKQVKITPSGRNDGKSFKDGEQIIKVSYGEVHSDVIEILTNPWLIYTNSTNQGNYISTESAPTSSEYASKYSGIHQYYNPIKVRFTLPSAWVGEGGVKGSYKDVGSVAGGSGKDTDLDEDKMKIDMGRRYRNNRINW
ncbi:hypothetical protein OFO01_08055 [Campylobacter sp. JMF_01 NE2]|uniref:hypothetical protein n=1 Tax=unclassified Campylobacter TaxID=2593542 RepID=UPI0022EA0AEF|nr:MULTISPECIES: hypothetical protein [unclassified Campylobacter]MDA3053361.1 hypothetical protein [Campylobacter sp. JMF_03 NE3]MDA3067733.1 hypothetical protein [Campylobacter sp. JMF_01 NE2]